MIVDLESINGDLPQPHPFVQKLFFLRLKRNVFIIVFLGLHKTLPNTFECVQRKSWIDY